MALGAENNIPWEVVENPLEFIEKFKNEKGKVIALEQDERAVDYKEAAIAEIRGSRF